MNEEFISTSSNSRFSDEGALLPWDEAVRRYEVEAAANILAQVLSVPLLVSSLSVTRTLCFKGSPISHPLS